MFSVEGGCSAKMEVTILRLPHMDIVLNRDNSMEEEEDMKLQNKEEVILRRSTRHTNQGQEQRIWEKDAGENIGRKKRSRLRQNSVMDEDEEEDTEKEMKRKEPGHRRQNRMRQESVSLTVSEIS